MKINSRLFLSGLATKILYDFLSSSLRSKCPVHFFSPSFAQCYYVCGWVQSFDSPNYVVFVSLPLFLLSVFRTIWTNYVLSMPDTKFHTDKELQAKL
jgi:hypothetical protein